jgi:hypothetical protein
MVKILIVLLGILMALSFYIIQPISAGGDKVGGDLGQGDVNQNVNTEFEGVCPYDNCPPLK